MAKEIRKYPLTYGPFPEVMMPAGAIVRVVGPQHGLVCVWAEVDPSEEEERRVFMVAATGAELDYDGERRYLGTVMVSEGTLVWHVFELVREEQA